MDCTCVARRSLEDNIRDRSRKPLAGQGYALMRGLLGWPQPPFRTLDELRTVHGLEAIETFSAASLRLGDLIDQIGTGERRSWGFGTLSKALGNVFGLDVVISESAGPRHIFIGAPNSAAPLHRDQGDLLAIQLVGTKAWCLIPPDAPIPAADVYRELQGVEISDLDIDSAADLLERHGQPPPTRVTLGPGDALFLRSEWWHEVRSQTPALSVSIPLR
jgi:hypothetical protein